MPAVSSGGEGRKQKKNHLPRSPRQGVPGIGSPPRAPEVETGMDTGAAGQGRGGPASSLRRDESETPSGGRSVTSRHLVPTCLPPAPSLSAGSGAGVGGSEAVTAWLPQPHFAASGPGTRGRALPGTKQSVHMEASGMFQKAALATGCSALGLGWLRCGSKNGRLT